MLSSLKNKFQGCLMGAYLGAQLDEHSPHIDHIFNSICQLLHTIINEENTVDQISLFSENKLLANDQELALSILPLILISHDNLSELEQQIDLINEKIGISVMARENLKIWSKAIALMCQNQTTPENLIEQILLNQKNPETELMQQLHIVNQYQQKRKSLQDLLKELTKQKYSELSPIVLALYYFICTPEDFNLTIKRAKIPSNYQNKNILGLTGALSGLHNSDYTSNKWQLTKKDDKMTQEIEMLTEKLFIKWCGVYQIQENDIFNLTKVSPINLIQPRNWPK
jgi:hypothetical protein